MNEWMNEWMDNDIGDNEKDEVTSGKRGEGGEGERSGKWGWRKEREDGEA